ncbi:hypothetical protein EMIT0196MI5_60200 [Pseudomonas sp. IT-196MI5]
MVRRFAPHWGADIVSHCRSELAREDSVSVTVILDVPGSSRARESELSVTMMLGHSCGRKGDLPGNPLR